VALAALETLLETHMGLSAGSIGPAAIARAVQERLSACQLDDVDRYVERVRGSSAELQALVEGVVVPETWFYRDPEAFRMLGRVIRDTWMPAHPTEVLSVLSLPCSTGEEPYSIAMALLDAGVPAQRFRVDAVDISARSLSKATAAVYGKNSFRSAEAGFQRRHFSPTPSGELLNPTVRRQVQFQQGNLFAMAAVSWATYDVVFCRNVLIYFDRPMQDRAMAIVEGLLRPAGLLFVAPAETGLPLSRGLRPTGDLTAYAFRREVRARDEASSAGPRLPPRVAAAPLPRSRTSATVTARVPDPAGHADDDLIEAGRLADQGHLVEAAVRCERHVARYGPSATAFYLTGLVRDAAGTHAEAAAYYRKALYLDPDHYEAQIHLSLLLEQQGDRAGAEVLRRRARRLEDRNKGRGA
jgi:chemotaxis protein methyltransferase WspC